jgi:hypothetical protein
VVLAVAVAVAVMVLLVGPLAWAAVLWRDAGRGAAVGATARTVAALAGLPPSAVVTVVATLLVALLQATVGGWLGRASTSRTAAAHVRRRDRVAEPQP